MNKISSSIYYSFKYILTVILFYYINKVIGIPSLYTIVFAIPFLNYLVLLWSLLKPLQENTTIKKEDIFMPFLTITTIFNILFFYIEHFNTEIVVLISVINVIEFIFMKPKN